jgi:hypothetical protein
VVAGLTALSTALAVALVATVAVYHVRLSRALAQKVEEQRQEIVQLNLNFAVMEQADGDAFTAVLCLAEALRLNEEGGGSGRDQRALIANALRDSPRLMRMRTHNEQVVCTSLTNSGGWVATTRADYSIRVWDVVSGTAHGRELNPDEATRHGALSADGRFLATVGAGGVVRVWDVLAGTPRLLPDAGEEVGRVAFPAGANVLLTEPAGRVRLWDLTTDPPAPLSAPWDGAAFTALDEDARWLFTQDRKRAGQVWDMATGEAVGPPVRLEQTVTAAAVSADGRRLALLAEGGTLRVWDGIAADWLGHVMRPRGEVTRLAFSPDGERVISAGPQPGAQVWRVWAGTAIDVPSRKATAGAAIHFSPDGRLLVARQDTGARVWDTVTGKAVTPPLRHGTPVIDAAFLDAGRQVVTVSKAGTVRVWQLPSPAADDGAIPISWDDRPSPEIITWAHLLACARINASQQHEALDESTLQQEWESLRGRDGARNLSRK